MLGVRKDSYISRCIRDIIVNYLPRFASPVHPLIDCLGVELLSSDAETELLTFSLEVIRDHFFIRRNSTNLTQTLYFICELLFGKPDDYVQLVMTILMTPLLDLLLLLDDVTNKNKATEILQIFMDTSKRTYKTTFRGTVQELVGRFVSCNLGFHSVRVYKVLELLTALHEELVVDLLPRVYEALTNVEKKRGVGLDQTLRQGYEKLNSLVGVDLAAIDLMAMEDIIL